MDEKVQKESQKVNNNEADSWRWTHKMTTIISIKWVQSKRILCASNYALPLTLRAADSKYISVILSVCQ